jgi:hypothetical protein
MSKLLAGTFVGLAFALAATSATAAEPNATLSNVSGNVSVNQGKEFAPAQADMRLKPGDRVMVSDKGSATITFDDACRLDLGESKIITVPAKSACAGAVVAQQGVGPGAGGGGAAIGDEGHGNGGVAIMVGVVAAIDLWWLSEDDEETASP